MNNLFVWTEIYNCGKIGKIALESFRTYHPTQEVNVYGVPADFQVVSHVPGLIYHTISSQNCEGFKQGHFGTAMLWASLLGQRKEQYMVHFDSDVIFRQECVSYITNELQKGFSLVGPIRNYIHNPNNRNDVRHLPDLAQTYFFGFDRTKITMRDYSTMTKMCQGTFNPHGHPVIDFFDPVMFDIIRNGGKVAILEQEDFGSCDFYGKRAVGKYTEENRHMDFGNKICHFSAVGSGMNFYNNGSVNVPKSYVDYAVERYALYCLIFYNETLNTSIDIGKYKAIINNSHWF